MDQLNFRSRDFVHLHLHSDYSLLQSTIKLKPLSERVKNFDMKACALTDLGNMYGAVSFYSAMKAAEVKPIIGYEAFVAPGSRFDRDASVRAGERPYYNLVLLAKDNDGYKNLVYLASKAFTDGLHHKPRIDLELLAERSKGLVGISSGPNGAVRHFLRQDEIPKATAAAREYADIFGDGNFYLEISDHDTEECIKATRQIAEISASTGISMVASNEAYYISEEDARAHEVLLCIGEGRALTDGGKYTFPSTKYYVRSAEEMWDIFGSDFPSALTNTLRIAEACDVRLPIGDNNYQLPVYPIPADSGCVSVDEYFQRILKDSFKERRETVWLPMKAAGKLKYELENYDQRLEQEKEVIRKMGFLDYFLIVWDFIRHARQRGIPVGPGRGSAAGSLVAYCLGITGIDPLQYDLLFERFLNPERISMPDIDIDFCIRGRGDVINHVCEVYGRDSVCQIITFGTMASKAAIKDVGRALSMPYGDVERIAKLIPPPVRGRNVSISQALEQVSELKAAIAADPRVKDLVELALKLEGCSRHSSVHAAGVVISPTPLCELVPVAVSPKNELTSQYSMNDLEKVGMLKMDFLALTTLTVIDDCLRSIKEKAGIEVDWSSIPLNDEKTMELFSEGRTDAVFQFESSGMQEICRRLKPKELEDLSALNALYRPGPIDGGMIDDYIARHRGEKAVRYITPEMKDILSNTYGVLVYQEQIMQLAQKLADYTLGEADMMRRAMGKKKREEMAVHEEKFVSGAVANGIKRDKAEEIFRLMAQFADYGFNRSHSIAYAYLAFQTAYLKAHFPSYFFAAVLSHEADDSTKVYKYSTELRSVGLKFLPPDVNESGDDFTPSGDAVRFGLTAIKGIGSATVNAIVTARQAGPFTSFFDFAGRIEPSYLNRRGLESLIASGSFDTMKPPSASIGKWRASLMRAIEPALAWALREREDKQRGQSALFGAVPETAAPQERLPKIEPWSQAELCRQEKSALGFYLSVHPLDAYKETLEALSIRNVGDYEEIKAGDLLTLAGIVSGSQTRHSKKGNRFCSFRLDDQSTSVKCLAWADAYGKFGQCMKNDELIIVEGRVESVEANEITFIVSEARPLADAVCRSARAVSVQLPDSDLDEDLLHEIFSILSHSTGKCDVFLQVPIKSHFVRLHSQPLRVQGSAGLEKELASKGCRVNWIL